VDDGALFKKGGKQARLVLATLTKLVQILLASGKGRFPNIL
jgi:hypothetical protein